MIKYLDEIAHRWVALKRNAPPNRSVTGYGLKIPSPCMIQIGNRARRVYTMIFSNSGSSYIVIGGERVFLRSWDCQFGTHDVQSDGSHLVDGIDIFKKSLI